MEVISYDEAMARIADLPTHRPQIAVPLAVAAGRILCQDLALLHDQPPFDRATMDGYAVSCPGDAEQRFTVIGTIRAGDASDLVPQPGQAVRIMTGAPVPAGATVVPIEDTDGGETTVQVNDTRHLDGRRNVAFQGEDGRAGDGILSAGTRLGPACLAAAAMAGHQQLTVRQKPRVRILVSGDELGADNAAGIADSNGPFLLGFLGGFGIGADHVHLPDTTEATAAALQSDDVEVIITTGGVSMGDRDHIPSVAAASGYQIITHGVAIQPGKPVLIARHPSGRLLIGLPGNPVSVIVTAHLFLAAILERVFGLDAPQWEERALASPWTKGKRRLLFLPARCDGADLHPVMWNGSGDLLAAAHGDGLAMFEPGRSYAAGERVPFLPYVGHHPGQVGRLPGRETVAHGPRC